jgi:hypothetical protein
MRALSIIALGLAAMSSACSGAPSKPPAPSQPAPSAQPAPQPGAGWATARWTRHDSLAHGFSMPLPSDPAWKIEDAKDSWLVATHAPTSTVVVARMLGTDGLANRARCETRARDLRALPPREGTSVIDKHRVDMPSGFDTIVEVGLLPTDPGKPITGYVLAFGGWSKKCFIYALTTTAQGRGAEEAVADRLALFMERSFLKMRFASGPNMVVPREKPPLGPAPLK